MLAWIEEGWITKVPDWKTTRLPDFDWKIQREGGRMKQRFPDAKQCRGCWKIKRYSPGSLEHIRNCVSFEGTRFWNPKNPLMWKRVGNPLNIRKHESEDPKMFAKSKVFVPDPVEWLWGQWSGQLFAVVPAACYRKIENETWCNNWSRLMSRQHHDGAIVVKRDWLCCSWDEMKIKELICAFNK